MPPSTIPIFPLPGLVLFPRTLIPLHIFESRYVKMVEDALAGDRRIAAASLRKGWEKDYFGRPPIHRVVTPARILHEERLPGNRFNILLEGIERAEVLEELDSAPYRRVKAAGLVDLMEESERDTIRSATRDLIELAARIAEQNHDLKGPLTNLDNQHLHPGIIADQVAALVIRDAYERQSLLEERRVLRRVMLVNVQLRRQLAEPERTNMPSQDAL